MALVVQFVGVLRTPIDVVCIGKIVGEFTPLHICAVSSHQVVHQFIRIRKLQRLVRLPSHMFLLVFPGRIPLRPFPINLRMLRLNIRVNPSVLLRRIFTTNTQNVLWFQFKRRGKRIRCHGLACHFGGHFRPVVDFSQTLNLNGSNGLMGA